MASGHGKVASPINPPSCSSLLLPGDRQDPSEKIQSKPWKLARMDVMFAASARIPLSSFDPPAVDAAADPPKSCLLDNKPFFGESTNATTAWYHIKDPEGDEMSIQASLFVARPPLVSYVLAWSTGTYFAQVPFIHCTHGGLILLNMAVHTKRTSFSQYYIYQPSAPSLQLVPQSEDRCLAEESCGVGLVSDGGGGYHVAVLTTQGGGDVELFLFSSKTGTWTMKKPLLVSLDQDRAADFVPDKVITICDNGVLAFVDMWNGILIGDVLQGDGRPEFHHIPLPFGDPHRPWMESYRLMPRDVSIDIMPAGNLRIRLADVVCRTDLSAWVATTSITTTAATSPWRQLDQWRIDSLLQAPQLSVGEGVNIDGLLPPPDEEDLNPLDLGYLFVDRPMLSLDSDNIVCFLAKRQYRDRQVFAIAVNMVAKELEGVLPLQTGRITRLFYSTISSHLNMTAAADTSGAKGDLKRLAMHLQPYPQKRHQQQLSMESSVAGGQGQDLVGAHDGDDMEGLEHSKSDF